MQKNLILCIFLFASFSMLAQKKKATKNVIIRGHITQTADYCGGARPNDEMIKTLSTPQPLPEKEIYIKIGSINTSSAPIIKKVKTDQNGNFTITLKSGATYSFLEEWKGKPLEIPKNTEYTKWDAQCFRTRYATSDYVLKVKKSGNPLVNINYHLPCFYHPYCGEYSGPLPP